MADEVDRACALFSPFLSADREAQPLYLKIKVKNLTRRLSDTRPFPSWNVEPYASTFGLCSVQSPFARRNYNCSFGAFFQFDQPNVSDVTKKCGSAFGLET
jgi:hypothetical protein